MAGNETPMVEASNEGGGRSGFLPGRLEYRPARWLSALGTAIAIILLPAGLNSQLSFLVWSTPVVAGFLLMGVARIWDATKRDGGITRERAVALLVLHLGTPVALLGLVAPEHVGTAIRVAAVGIGVSAFGLGYVWNRRLLQARDAIRTDERLKSLKRKAAYRVAQLTYGLVVVGALFVLAVEPNASAPLVPLMVGIMLFGALAYVVFYGYYEVQY